MKNSSLKPHYSSMEVVGNINRARENEWRRRLEDKDSLLLSSTEVAQIKPIGHYTHAFVSTELQLREQRHSKTDIFGDVVKIIPFRDQTVAKGLTPVLVAKLSSPAHPFKVVDRASLLSYMLKNSLQPKQKLAFSKKGLSPGLHVRMERAERTIFNTDHPLNRPLLGERFGIELPPIEERPSIITLPDRPLIGQTVRVLTMPPKLCLQDPQLSLPPIPEYDLSKGIYSLTKRGWIPASAQITLKPHPIVHQQMRLQQFQNKFIKPEAKPKLAKEFTSSETTVTRTNRELPCIQVKGSASSSEALRNVSAVTGYSLGGVVTPPKTAYSLRRSIVVDPRKMSSIVSPTSRSKASSITARHSSGYATRSGRVTSPQEKDVIDFEEEKQEAYTLKLINGVLDEHTPQFKAFKLIYWLDWSRMYPSLKKLSKQLIKYAVPKTIINGERLVKMLDNRDEEEGDDFTLEELYDILDNDFEVQTIIMRTGQQFKGPKGRHLAATYIQKTWRCYRDHANYCQYKFLKNVVVVIENFWQKMLKRKRMREQQLRTYHSQLMQLRQRAQVFADNWDHIKEKRRVVIHIPSLGYCGDIRKKYIPAISVRQSTQMARLCEIMDPNVDVIYVSPTPVFEETHTYYRRLLGLAGAVSSGKVQDQIDISHRYTILEPEALHRFATKPMCLATLLKYSPNTLKKIKELIKGKNAYIVPGITHQDDVAVAHVLDVPVLGCDPEVAAKYRSKSSCRDIFKAADVDVAPGVGHISSQQQLYESLTQLVLDNLNIERWVLKLDYEFDGRGIANCYVTKHLHCASWVQKQAQRYGYLWQPGYAQEQAFGKVLEELPYILKKFTILPKDYITWDLFLQTFLSQGGVVEAYPNPGEDSSLPCLTVNVLVAPNGDVSILNAGDQIHSDSIFCCWGYTVPQCALEALTVNKTCKSVGKICYQYGLTGYIKIDLATFINPMTLKLLVWGIDLHFGYSDLLALSRLADYLTLARFHVKDHGYSIPRTSARPTRPQSQALQHPSRDRYFCEERYCVMSSRLSHTNLSMLQYSVLFSLCRANGIGFDVKEREGTVFTLVDNIHREQIGMITMGHSLPSALATFGRHLITLNEELSIPGMRGQYNFQPAIENIEEMLDLIQVRMEELEREVEERREEDSRYDEHKAEPEESGREQSEEQSQD